MLFPKLTQPETQRQMVSAFSGYDHRSRISDSAFYHMENMSGRAYPSIAVREKRGFVENLGECLGFLFKDGAIVIKKTDTVDKLFYNGYDMSSYFSLNAKMRGLRRTVLSMGAYAVIFPDKVYFNTQDFSDSGSMESFWSCPDDSTVYYSLCAEDGSGINITYTQSTEPDSSQNGDWWLDISRTPNALLRYSAETGSWTEVAAAFTKIEAPGIGAGFSLYDGVLIEGCAVSSDEYGEETTRQVEALNTYAPIMAKDDGYIVISGPIYNACSQKGGVKVSRTVPDLDFVTECENRLWGCRYGVFDGQAVNEICCCALGDFKNWNRYLGISTDSYAASRGSDGVWTGAFTYMGSPLFFKENCIERVYPSAFGAHQIVTSQCPGVEAGSHMSLAVSNNALYYKSPFGVCAYDGAAPYIVSDALGDVSYKNAVFASLGGVLYASMKDEAGASHLFTYDTKRNIWHREDDLDVLFFSQKGAELYAVCSTENGHALYAVTGSEGEPEGDISWCAETGDLGLSMPDNKYITRFNIRMHLNKGGEVSVYTDYDSEGSYKHVGTYEGAGLLFSVTVPAPMHRCDHMRIKLCGKGDCRIYSITKTVGRGSDM